MSAEGAQVWKVSEGESTSSPVLSSFRSWNIDAKYVFVFSKYNFILAFS